METKKELMLYWWNNYLENFSPTLYDFYVFKDLLEKDIDAVINFVIDSYTFYNGPATILLTIRTDQINEFLNVIKKIPSKDQEAYDNFKIAFLNELVSTSGIDLEKGR